MLEQLLSGSPGLANFYPESGPGNKILLKGDLQAGYFGLIDAAELFATGQLGANLGLAIGTPLNGAGGWFKFAYKGKFFFIARTQEHFQISWTDLYNLGAVYGTRDNGAYPIGDGVWQYRPQHKVENGRKWFLIPRLARMTAVDPGRSSAPVADTLNTEWAQTFCRVTTNAFGSTDKWASHPATTYAFAGQYMGDWGLNSNAENLSAAWSAGLGAAVSLTPVVRAKTGASGNAFWRPVLEVIPSNTLMDPYQVADQSYGVLPPAIKTVDVAEWGVQLPKNPRTLWPTKQPVITDYSYPLAVNKPKNLQGSANMGLNPFSVTGGGANLVSGPRNLIYQSTNLNPFSVSGSIIA